MPKTATPAFRQSLRDRAGGLCECTMRGCDHHPPGRRCNALLRSPGWQAHRRSAGGDYTLGNTIAMCARCHRNTRTYGRG